MQVLSRQACYLMVFFGLIRAAFLRGNGSWVWLFPEYIRQIANLYSSDYGYSHCHFWCLCIFLLS